MSGAQERSRHRKSSLLSAAVDLIVAHGMAAVTHRVVADRAGVPLASVRYYFRSREELLLACLDDIDRRRSEEAARIIEEVRDRVPLSASQLAPLTLRAYYGPVVDDAVLRGTIGWVIDCSRAGEVASDKLADLRLVVDRDMAALLEAGGFAEVPVELIMTAIDGSIITAAAERRPGIARRVEEVVALVLSGTFA